MRKPARVLSFQSLLVGRQSDEGPARFTAFDPQAGTLGRRFWFAKGGETNMLVSAMVKHFERIGGRDPA